MRIFTANKKLWVARLVKFRLRCGRGEALVGELKGLFKGLVYGGVIIMTIETYTGWLPPIWVIPFFWVAQKAGEYFLGLLDEKRIKIWQYEVAYVPKKINPWTQEVLKILKEIKYYAKTKEMGDKTKVRNDFDTPSQSTTRIDSRWPII